MSNPQPLKIGALFTLSGGVGALGQDSFDGAEAARRLVNASGGVVGRQVEWVLRDAETPAAAAEHAERMIREEGVRAIVGCYGSDHTIAVSKVCEQWGAVLFVTTAWTSHLFDHRPTLTFRVNNFAKPVQEAAVQYVSEVALPALGRSWADARMLVVHESSGYGRSCAEETINALRSRGATPAGVFQYDYQYGAGGADLTGLARQVGEARADVLFASSFINDAVELLQAMDASKSRPPIVMTSSAGFGLYTLNRAGELPQAVFSANAPAHIAPEALDDDGRRLQREFERALSGVCGREPTGFNAMAFCATWALLMDVLPKASDLADAQAIRRAALACDVPLGRYPNGWGLRFDSAGQNTRSPSCVDQWQNGRLRTVWPASMAVSVPELP